MACEVGHVILAVKDDGFQFHVSAGRTRDGSRHIQTQGLRFYFFHPLSSNPQIPPDFVKADFFDTHIWFGFSGKQVLILQEKSSLGGGWNHQLDHDMIRNPGRPRSPSNPTESPGDELKALPAIGSMARGYIHMNGRFFYGGVNVGKTWEFWWTFSCI